MASAVSVPIDDDEGGGLSAHELVRSIVNPYFLSLSFTFLEEKSGYSLYGARVVFPGLVDRARKFVLLFVPGPPPRRRGAITDFPWSNLQTRILAPGYDLPPQEWSYPRLPDPRMEITERTPAHTRFTLPGLPASLVYLHDTTTKCVGPSCSAKYQIYNHTPLSKALSSFRISMTLN